MAVTTMQERYEGRIIKALSGFYYVRRSGIGDVYQCRARGLFRKDNMSPLVGDKVLIQITDTKDMEGNVEEILPRSSELKRPAVANIDLVLVIFAAKNPAPNLNMLDRILVELEHLGLSAVICFNKKDLVSDEKRKALTEIYRNTGYPIVWTDAKSGASVDEIRSLLRGHLAVVAGPSGAGKSTLINSLAGTVVMETGEVSKKIRRGRQTTRHTEIVFLEEHTYICDTPGFSSLNLLEITPVGLTDCFPEFREGAACCRFAGCAHISEPDCGVKALLQDKLISQERYDSYRLIYDELSSQNSY